MIINTNNLLKNALLNKYAVGAFTVYNIEWLKAVLLAAEDSKSPIIISVSPASAKYMGGYKTAYNIINNYINIYSLSIPVAIHLDHGGYDDAIQCIKIGYSSIMFDGSKYSIKRNMQLTSEIVKLAHKKNISVEAEVGNIKGVEDNIELIQGELSDPSECELLASTGINSLAAAVGSIHGEYPPNWIGLNFSLLKKIRLRINNMPLVLHGGSGITNEEIKKSIKYGICKINVNTDCQIEFCKGLLEYLDGANKNNKGWYNPIKLFKPATDNIYNIVKEKIILFGSYGRINN